MQRLMFEETGRYSWREAADPQISTPEQALVRPIAVACCDLDVGVAQGVLPLPPGHAVGHEGVGEVVAVGDGVRSATVTALGNTTVLVVNKPDFYELVARDQSLGVKLLWGFLQNLAERLKAVSNQLITKR